VADEHPAEEAQGGERALSWGRYRLVAAMVTRGVEAELKPRLDEFVELAARHRVVPVWCELLADRLTPVGAYAAVVGEGTGFLLESVEGGERFGRYSFVGREPIGSLALRGGELDVQGIASATLAGEQPAGILDALERLLRRLVAPALPELPPLHGGLVGYLGYDVVREVERLGPGRPDDRGLPDAIMWVIGQLCVFDHLRQRVVLVDNVVLDDRAPRSRVRAAYEQAGERLEALAAALGDARSGPLLALEESVAPIPTSETVGRKAYCAAVQVAKELIAQGEIFQVVLSRRFDFELGADPFDVYRVLRVLNPSPYLYYLHAPELAIAGSSPEPMVRVQGDRVVTRPIAGTRPRGATPEEDRRLAAELVEHPKERAEHVMLVDLARNDLGRVVVFGSERVDELMVLERYSHVMHLTSQVSGRLAPGKGPVDVLRATMPAGTLSGAPKVRAMQVIDELEPTRRGIYGGVVGYLDFSGNLDTAIAIRTLVATPDGRAFVQAGAGIVADSDPEAEASECENKAAALLAATAAARQLRPVGTVSEPIGLLMARPSVAQP
jgi:anthranilate synthase component 1